MTISGVTASAVSALTANAAKISAVADNVANVGTVGFKATQVRTADEMLSALLDFQA